MAAVVLRVDAPVDRVWRVLGERWGEVHRVIPSLSASRLRTPGAPGPGAVRACTLRKPLMGISVVEERVTRWREGESFAYVFDAPPWPMRSVSNAWSLAPEGDGTRLTLTPSMRLRGGRAFQWLAPALLWAMSRSLKADLPLMVAAIERECASLDAAPPAGPAGAAGEA